MTLISPRFPSRQLRAVEGGGAAMGRGSKGRTIHLVQQALIDLGHPMPKSTRSVSYSPDGIFGSEMEARLKEFQRKYGLSQTGVIDQATIQKMDLLLKGYKHRVRLHFRNVAEHNVGYAKSLKDALIVYGQYGIKVEFGSGQSLALTPAETALFDKIDGSCKWTINTGEMNRLHGMGNPVPNNEILVYYVKEFASGGLGCGGHATNRPAVTVASISSRWDTAHEVCHVLLGSGFAPVHINDRRNLMHPTAPSYSTLPVLTDKQVTQIRKHVCCIAI